MTERIMKFIFNNPMATLIMSVFIIPTVVILLIIIVAVFIPSNAGLEFYVNCYHDSKEFLSCDHGKIKNKESIFIYKEVRGGNDTNKLIFENVSFKEYNDSKFDNYFLSEDNKKAWPGAGFSNSKYTVGFYHSVSGNARVGVYLSEKIRPPQDDEDDYDEGFLLMVDSFQNEKILCPYVSVSDMRLKEEIEYNKKNKQHESFAFEHFPSLKKSCIPMILKTEQK